jgi:glycosyl transferase, family 25
MRSTDPQPTEDMAVKAYVINLPQAQARRKFMREQLDRLGLAYEFVPAIDGNALTERQRRLVDWSAVHAPGSGLWPEMVGCCLSHFDVYRRVASDSRRCALILEDDARLPDDLPDLLSRLDAQVTDSEAVLLHYRTAIRGQRVTLAKEDGISLGHFELLHSQSALGSAAAYVLTRATCQRMLDQALPVHQPSDWWTTYVATGVLTTVRCVYPCPVTVESSFKSQLGYLSGGVIARLATLVYRHKLFPFHQLFRWRRRRFEQQAGRVELV